METLEWGTIKERVRTLLNASAGIVGADGFIDEQLRLCAINLQTRIPAFWPTKIKTISPEELLVDGLTSVGTLTANVKPTEYYLVDADDDDLTEEQRKHHHERGMLIVWPWNHRFDLQRGKIPEKEQGFISFSPNGRDFVVYPTLDETDRLVIHYREKQTSFTDNEATGFPDDAVDAFYAWVKAAVADDIDHDPATAIRFRSGQYSAPGRYEHAVQDLFVTYNNGLTQNTLP